MTDDPAAEAGTEGARKLLVESEAVLEDLLAGFRNMSERLAEGKDVAQTEVSRTRTALAGVRATLLDEVKRHEARVFNTKGLTATAPLDLDAIRSQIGRRLDRIRDAQGSD